MRFVLSGDSSYRKTLGLKGLKIMLEKVIAVLVLLLLTLAIICKAQAGSVAGILQTVSVDVQFKDDAAKLSGHYRRCRHGIFENPVTLGKRKGLVN